MPRKSVEKPKEEKANKTASKTPKTTRKVPESPSMDKLLDCKANPSLTAQLERLGFVPADKEGMTFREAIMCAQITAAVKGDLKAAQDVVKSLDKKTPLEEYVRGIGGE